MKPNPVVWFEIYVQDMERARKFYETVFRCQLEPMAAPEGEASGLQMLVCCICPVFAPLFELFFVVPFPFFLTEPGTVRRQASCG